MRTTGPILAMGAITMGNQTVIGGKPLDLRVPVATAVAAGLMALVEKGWPTLAVGLTWIALVTLLLVRVNGTPSPLESVAKLVGG